MENKQKQNPDAVCANTQPSDDSKITQEQANRLLKAIFAKKSEDPDDNYPDTPREKVGYSQYVSTQTLQDLGRAIHRINRLYSLLSVAEKNGKNELPDIIANNELRMALVPLMRIKSDVGEVTGMLSGLYRDTEVDKA